MDSHVVPAYPEHFFFDLPVQSGGNHLFYEVSFSKAKWIELGEPNMERFFLYFRFPHFSLCESPFIHMRLLY